MEGVGARPDRAPILPWCREDGGCWIDGPSAPASGPGSSAPGSNWNWLCAAHQWKPALGPTGPCFPRRSHAQRGRSHRPSAIRRGRDRRLHATHRPLPARAGPGPPGRPGRPRGRQAPDRAHRDQVAGHPGRACRQLGGARPSRQEHHRPAPGRRAGPDPGHHPGPARTRLPAPGPCGVPGHPADAVGRLPPRTHPVPGPRARGPGRQPGGGRPARLPGRPARRPAPAAPLRRPQARDRPGRLGRSGDLHQGQARLDRHHPRPAWPGRPPAASPLPGRPGPAARGSGGASAQSAWQRLHSGSILGGPT
jgi:hypothetical protein